MDQGSNLNVSSCRKTRFEQNWKAWKISHFWEMSGRAGIVREFFTTFIIIREKSVKTNWLAFLLTNVWFFHIVVTPFIVRKRELSRAAYYSNYL